MKGKQQQDFRVEKYIRYGIRKYSFGAASVAIAAGLMFLGNGAVSASETAVNGNGSDVAVVSANTEDNQDKVVTPVVDNKEVKEEAKPEVATPAVTPKVEESKKEEAQKTEEVTKEEAAPKLDKSQLESYVNEVAGKLAAGKYANKTDESLALLNADLEAAKTALSNATSQDELKAAYNKLVTTVNSKLKNKPVEKKETLAVDTTNGKETVGKKAENTEKKSESNAIENTGSKDERNGKELVEGSNLRSANEGYTLASTELRKENGEFATATGKTYKELDSNAAYRIYVKGFQSENTEEVAKNNPQPGTGARTDLPLSKTEAQKLGREAAMWNNKLRASGQNNNTNSYGSGGAYEYLATEIYGYTYEQGNHYVYLKDVTKRFDLNDEAKAAGYTIKSVTPLNLPPGLGYNAATDTVEGYIGANIQNGVYDFRYELTVAKGDTEQKVFFRDLQAGWIGWQDSTAPRIQGSSTMVTIGEDVSHELKYVDNDGVNKDTRANYQREDGSKFVAGSKTAPNSTAKKAEFVAADGTTVKSMSSPQTVTAYTTLNGKTNGTKPVSLDDTIPGLTYAPETGLITGKPTEAGIFTVAALAKDYNSASAWNMNGQEAHENITIAVAPKITVKNVEAYATNVPVTISKGANKAEITTPDGKVTKLVVKDGNWVVAAGTTNTAVQEGAVLAPVATSGESTINLTVTPEATKYVGVDSIVAKATTDRVQAYLQRETVKVKDHNQKEYVATFNRATGKYSLPVEDAYHLEENGDNTILTERRVYTEAQPNGDVKLFVYEFTRTWNAKSSATNLVDKVAEIRKNGEVTAVGDVFRTETLLPNDQTSSTQGRTIKVNYDSVTNQWTASDGSMVTATETGAGWKVSTDSGFNGYIAFREAVGSDLASIQNAKPTGTSTSYSEEKGATVDLIKSTKANVAFADTIDDKTSATDSDTIKTKVTATAPDGTVTTFDGAQAEETAYIQAQRSAAEKTQAAAQAVKEKQEEQNKLASLQERLDRQIRMVEDAQTALDNLKLRTISPTAEEMAQRMLNVAKEIKAKLEADIEAAKGNVATLDSKVTATRTEAMKAEETVETARTALKTAAEANLAKANAYVLSQKGRYKVTARAVDSNGVVTTPTVDGTDAGEVTEDAVAETTYYIVVTEPEKSSGAQGQKQTDSMADNFNDGKEGTTVSDYKLVDPTTGNKVSSVTTDQGTYTVDPTTGEVTFTPVEGFVGTATPMKVSANVTFNDEQGNPVTVATENTYTPTVYGVQPSTDETTGKQGQTQTSKSGKDRFSELNTATNTPDGTNVDWSTAAYSLEGANEKDEVEVEGEGTYSIDPTTGVVTFKPLPTFKGEGKGVNVQVSVTATDSEGNKVPVTSKGKYTPEVTPVTPTGEDVTSTGKQGQEQTGTPKFTQGDETAPITINEKQPAKFVVNGQPVESTEISATKDGKEVGKYVIDPLTGVVTFKPNKDFIGTPDPATVEVKDKNGTPATATYTPTVTPVVPTAEPKETTGKQDQPQTQETESMFKQGDEVAPIDKTTVKLVDPSGNEVTTMPALKDGKEVGTYTIDPTTGVITFQPNKDFTGTPDPAKVVAKDTNGTKVETTYTPTVTPVVPTAEPKETTGKQGQPQTQETESMFKQGDEVAPIDKTTVKLVDPSGNEVTTMPAMKDGKEVGTYTIDPATGVITFQPNKDFVGTPDPAKVVAKDTNGTKVETTYTPTVTPVTPTADPAETTDIQGKEQNGKPTFTPGNPDVPMDNEVPATFEDGSTEKVIPGEGTYTVAPDGTVTFTPEKTFTGKGTGVTVKRVDKNGTPVTAKYTPNVTPVTPTADPAETTDIQGKEQNGKPTFTPGNPDVPMDDEVPATFEDGSTTKTIPGEGTYTVAPDGTVTFTPEKTFTGVGTGVTVKRVDKNGTPVTAKYTPTVTPVTPVGTPAESEGPKGQQQTGTPVFTPGNPNVPIDEDVPPTFEDGTTTKVVPGEGTYTIDKDGKVTFTPEKDFVGKAKGVTVKRVDKNGTPVTATYTPTVRPDTKFVVVGKDGKEVELVPSKDGKTPAEVIPGYKVVKTEVDEKGNTKHIYEKVTTTYKDKDGNVIPGTTTEEGTTPKKDIPGYRFVETKTLPNGDTEHIYEKVKTSFKDKDGNEIPGYPTEDGEQPKKDIPGYRFVETKKLPNGDTEHVYEKVKTSFKDKDGNEIPNYPTEDGEQPKKDIPGYRFVDTKKLPNGDIEHVYEKVSTPLIPQPNPGKQITTTWTDENGNPLKPTEPGSKEPGTIPGYEYVKTVTDPNGNIRHIFKKVEMPTPVEPSQPVQPVSPQEPTSPEKPVTPDMPAVPEQPKQPATPKYVEGQKELPNTGTEDNASLAALGLLGVLSGFGLVARKKKED